MAEKQEREITKVNIGGVVIGFLFWGTFQTFLFVGTPDVHDYVLLLLKRLTGGAE